MADSSAISLTYLDNLLELADKPFLSCILLSTILALCCSLIPHLQYKYKIISKITSDDNGKAADLLAFILIHIGSYRNYSFIECVYTNNSMELSLYLNYICTLVGAFFILAGSILFLTSFHRLGLRGMYYGDHFGFLFEEKIHTFPYNYFENPQYLGSFSCYLGFSLAFKSMPGLILTLYVYLCNEIIFFFNEKKKLKVFYPKNVNKAE